MELSKRALVFAEACRDGDIIEGKPVQLEMLARNVQALIDEYEARIAELEEQLGKCVSFEDSTVRSERLAQAEANYAEVKTHYADGEV